MACKEGRVKKFDLLRHKGDYHYNINVLKVRVYLALWRRTASGAVVNISDYLSCNFF